MENLQSIFDNGYVVVVALASIVSSVATIATMFIDESKVNTYVKPVMSLLNWLAGNVFKNKNATDK